MSEPRRTFSREFKLQIVKRIAAGELISALARELGVHRQLLYKWRDASRRGDPPRARGRPRKAEGSGSGADELEAARRRIEELERKVGQQTLELDFFKGALRRIEASRPAKGKPGETASSPRSKR
jgi:transposase